MTDTTPQILLTPTERTYFAALFEAADVDKDGFVNAQEVVFLTKSGLSSQHLFQIWTTLQADNKLSAAAFVTALRLVGIAQNGMQPNLQQLQTLKEFPLPKFEGFSIPQQQPQQQPQFQQAQQPFQQVQQPQFQQVQQPQQSHLLSSGGTQQVPAHLMSSGGTQQVIQPQILRTAPQPASIFSSTGGTQQSTSGGTQQVPAHLMSSGGTQQVPAHLMSSGGTQQVPAHLMSSGGTQQQVQPYLLSSGGTPQIPQNSTKLEWVITDQLRNNYKLYFEKCSKSDPNFISGSEATLLFAQSGLGPIDIAKIYLLSDRDGDQNLNFAEFCIAMFLITMKMDKQQIPERLPDSLLASVGIGVPQVSQQQAGIGNLLGVDTNGTNLSGSSSTSSSASSSPFSSVSSSNPMSIFSSNPGTKPSSVPTLFAPNTTTSAVPSPFAPTPQTSSAVPNTTSSTVPSPFVHPQLQSNPSFIAQNYSLFSQTTTLSAQSPFAPPTTTNSSAPTPFVPNTTTSAVPSPFAPTPQTSSAVPSPFAPAPQTSSAVPSPFAPTPQTSANVPSPFGAPSSSSTPFGSSGGAPLIEAGPIIGSLIAVEPSDPWALSSEDKTLFEQYFGQLDAAKQGKLSGVLLKDFFMQTKLATEELGKIWQLSDRNSDGYLDLPEFQIAMQLISVRKKKGIPVPPALPESLKHFGSTTASGGIIPTDALLQLSIAEATRQKEERERLERERIERERLERERIEREKLERERLERERAEEERKERERKELFMLKEQIIEKLKMKSEVIRELKKTQIQSLDVAGTLYANTQLLESKKKELKDAEIQLERKRILTEISSENLTQLTQKLKGACQHRDQLKATLEDKRKECLTWIQTLTTQIESAKVEIQKQQQTLLQARAAVLQAKNPNKDGISDDYYDKYIDDFGTVAGSPKGESAFFFPNTHPEFPPGFYPESDFGALITFKTTNSNEQAVQPQKSVQQSAQPQQPELPEQPRHTEEPLAQEEFDPFKDNLEL